MSERTNSKDKKEGLGAKETSDTDFDVEKASGNDVGHSSAEKVFEIYELIRNGATSFLWAEYKYLAIYICVFSLILLGVIWYGCNGWQYGVAAAIAFFIGAITSIICGFIGMSHILILNLFVFC